MYQIQEKAVKFSATFYRGHPGFLESFEKFGDRNRRVISVTSSWKS